MFGQNYQCQSNQPLERVSGYNIKVDIQSKNKTPMSDLNFDCEFYIQGVGRKVVISKADMVGIAQSGKAAEYFAQIYSTEMGNASGWLFCTVAIQQPDENWPCGFRDVTIENVFTGIYLGQPCGRIPRVPRGVCNGNQWHDGFKVSFEKVDYLPKGDKVEEDTNGGNEDNGNETTGIEVLYGVIRGLSSFESITDAQIANFTKLAKKQSEAVNVSVTEGDTLVVLAKGCTINKDDGIGGKVSFDTSIMGANGDSVTVNGVSYNAYGETFIVSGNVGFYIV